MCLGVFLMIWSVKLLDKTKLKRRFIWFCARLIVYLHKRMRDDDYKNG